MPHTRAAPEEKPHWVIEKRVNVAFILAMCAQTILLVGSGAALLTRMDSRIAALETTDLRILSERTERRQSIENRFEILMRDRDRLIRLEVGMEGIFKSLGRIETKLDTK